MHTKRFNKCFKKGVQFRVGAILRLPILDIFDKSEAILSGSNEQILLSP